MLSFSILLGLACAKDASIVANLELMGDSNQWNVSFARAVQDWEADIFTSFYYLLHSVRVRRGRED